MLPTIWAKLSPVRQAKKNLFRGNCYLEVLSFFLYPSGDNEERPCLSICTYMLSSTYRQLVPSICLIYSSQVFRISCQILMKYRVPGIKHELQNSGLILGWIHSKAVKSVCLSIKECNQLCHLIATAFTGFLSECLHNPQTNLYHLLFNDNCYANINGCCFVTF